VTGESWRYLLTVEGRGIDLSDGEVTLGRSRTATVRLEHESVSRSHALLTLHRGEVTIRDLNSSNGTWLSGKRLTGETRITQGERVQLGAAVVELKVFAPNVPSDRTALMDASELPGGEAAPVPAPTSPPPPVSPAPGPMEEQALIPDDAELETGSGLEEQPMTASGLFDDVDRQALAAGGEAALVIDEAPPAPPASPAVPPPPLPPAEAVTLPPSSALGPGVADVSLPLGGEPPAPGGRVSDLAGRIDRRAPDASRTNAAPAAGLGERLLAVLIDSAVVSVLNAILMSPVFLILYFRPELSGPRTGADPVLAGIALLSALVAAAADLLYFAGLWALRGRTPGQGLLRLAVVRRGVPPGAGIGWSTGILRFLFFALGAVPLYAGWWIALFSAERLAWHDRMAGTRVVRTP
jgi:pSer/pThr/pTyr-binding forkhead associated (FHA) protein/uncharacterized RDD family membrane protein YckC